MTRNFIVVGCGSMGRRRIRHVLELTDATVGIFDTRADRTAEAADMFDVVPLGTVDGFGDFDPDGIFICTPLPFDIEDDHYPFRRAGIPAMALIDFRYGGGRASHATNWHTPRDRMDLVCATSLKIVGDVVYTVLQRLDGALHRRDAQEGEGED